MVDSGIDPLDDAQEKIKAAEAAQREAVARMAWSDLDRGAKLRALAIGNAHS
jgi:hypothetical protein